MRRAPLQLDLVAPPRRSRWLGYLVLAGSLFVASEMFMRMREAQDQLARLDAMQGLLGDTRPTRALPRERLEEQMKEAQAVLRQLALPWAQLVESLESAAMPDVSVLQVQPDAQQRLLRVTAEAKGEETMFRYLRRLAAAEGFSDVHLVSHQVREDDPRRPLQFSLQVSFRSSP
jgi:nitrate reductase NapAB chaperone NapD